MGDSYAQLIIVLIIFVGVLAVTLWVTRWISGYQKVKGAGSNIELIEAASVSNGKYIQIVRLGNKYYALAMSKDNVTLICELEKDSLNLDSGGTPKMSFKEIIAGVGKSSDDEE
jgi:flagellar protein FliO/FliZ